MHPDVDSSEGQKRIEVCGNALPSHHEPTVFLLEPGKHPLSLEPWDGFFDRFATVFLGLPDAFWDLCPDTPLPSHLSPRFRIIAFIRRADLETFVGAASFAGAHLDRIEQRDHLRPLIAIGRRGAVRQGHPAPLREAVDEDAFAFPPVGDALAAT